MLHASTLQLHLPQSNPILCVHRHNSALGLLKAKAIDQAVGRALIDLHLADGKLHQVTNMKDPASTKTTFEGLALISPTEVRPSCYSRKLEEIATPVL